MNDCIQFNKESRLLRQLFKNEQEKSIAGESDALLSS